MNDLHGCRRWSLALLTAALANTLAGQSTELDAALDSLVNAPAFAGGRVGVAILDLRDGRELGNHAADQGFKTASNMKLISSAVALTTLGPEFRFTTSLQARGTIEAGVLRGDLRLIGAGDPTLGGRHEPNPSAVFDRMASRLIRDHGLREIRGRIVGIDDCHADEIMGDGWSWAYQGAGYAAQVSGLCFAENIVRVRVAPTAAGSPPTVTLTPDVGYLEIVNEAKTGTADARSNLHVDRRRAANVIVVRGTLAADSRPVNATCSVENPTVYAAHALRQALVRAGISVGGPAIDGDVLDADDDRPDQVLLTHESPRLADILVTLNKVSQNLYAEQLVRAACRGTRAEIDMDDAARHAAAVLRGWRIDTSGLQVADGSGLTRLNLVRPRQIAGLLAAMWRSDHRDLFLSTLPVAGVDGTLSGRFTDGPAHGHVHAKTGYISRVVALSGYVARPQATEPPIVFSILTNDFTTPTADAKAAVDRFVDQLAQHAGW